MLYKDLKIQFMTLLTDCRFRWVVLNPGPGEPQFIWHTWFKSSAHYEKAPWTELSVLDKGDIQNVQSRESPGPGLRTTGLDC